MDASWKKNLPAALSWISFAGSLIALAIFLYSNAHPILVSESWFLFLAAMLLVAFLSGVTGIILIIVSHIPNMEVYMFLCIFGVIMSFFIGVPVDIGYGIAHTPIG